MSKIKRLMYAVTGVVAALVMAVAIPGGHAHMAGPESLAGSIMNWQEKADHGYTK